MLDNRRMAMVDDTHVRNYRPLFSIDQYGPMQYVYEPLRAEQPGRDIAPSVAPNSPVQSGLISPSNYGVDSLDWL